MLRVANRVSGLVNKINKTRRPHGYILAPADKNFGFYLKHQYPERFLILVFNRNGQDNIVVIRSRGGFKNIGNIRLPFFADALIPISEREIFSDNVGRLDNVRRYCPARVSQYDAFKKRKIRQCAP